ncbi:MAG: hypothetical protein AB7O62_12990, partial [Pirellulales bacterium]
MDFIAILHWMGPGLVHTETVAKGDGGNKVTTRLLDMRDRQNRRRACYCMSGNLNSRHCIASPHNHPGKPHGFFPSGSRPRQSLPN